MDDTVLAAIGGEDAPRRRYLSSVNPVVGTRWSVFLILPDFRSSLPLRYSILEKYQLITEQDFK